MKPRKIGLFFGSFNPVHTGHMIIANYMATQTDLDQVWIELRRTILELRRFEQALLSATMDPYR